MTEYEMNIDGTVSEAEVELDAIREPVGSAEFLDMNTEDITSIIGNTVLDRETDVALNVSLHLDSSIGSVRALMVPSNSCIVNSDGINIALNLHFLE